MKQIIQNLSSFAVMTLIIVAAGCTALRPEQACQSDRPQAYYGNYEVVEVVEYAEGSNDTREMNRHLGKQVTIHEQLFQYQGISLQQPRYRIECYPVDKTEGEVSPHRWSTHFYGFDWDDRDVIKTLVVYEKDSNGELVMNGRFEIKSASELWEASNFWFLKFKKRDR